MLDIEISRNNEFPFRHYIEHKEKKEKTRARDEKGSSQDAADFSRGKQFLTPGSLAYHHANGTNPPP
jgi:hypothetical protein